MNLRIVLFMTMNCLGWIIEARGQVVYTADGEPTALEEEIRWHMNRARFDSARENELRDTHYTDVPAQAQPVAPHHAITLAARHHSEDMGRNNVFQHDTVPGSAYYDAINQPRPWHRMEAEGYAYSRAAENIAAGYGSAAAAYEGWWNSTGHRLNLMNTDLREVGNGYFNWEASTYRRYYTMDLGASGSTHFFTGTIFHDANGDGRYDQNEPVAGLEVSLVVQGSPHSSYDISAPAGNFAIPIQTIPDGSAVRVFVANRTATPMTISVPRDFDLLVEMNLLDGEAVEIGTFTQPSSVRNIGLRDLLPPDPAIIPPTLMLSVSGSTLVLAWPAEPGLEYLLQWASDFGIWNDSPEGYQTLTGATVILPLPSAGPRFYRIAVRPL